MKNAKYIFGLIVIGLFVVAVFSFNAWYEKNAKKYEVSFVAAPKAFAQVVREEKLTVAQLEAKLDEIVWGGESHHKVMNEGEIYPVFDPPKSLMAKCSTRGGKMHGECVSYGPRQEKVPTIMGDWPTLHKGATISEKDARACAEDNDCSRQFFIDRSVLIKGGVRAWCAARVGGTCDNDSVRPEIQIYIDLIREAKGITL